MIEGNTTDSGGLNGPLHGEAALPFDPADDSSCINAGGANCPLPAGLGPNVG
jgi:hypothetical protein